MRLDVYTKAQIKEKDDGTIVVTTENGISPIIQNNTIRSATPIVYGWLKQTGVNKALKTSWLR